MYTDAFGPLLNYRSLDPPASLQIHLQEEALVAAGSEDPEAWAGAFRHLMKTMPDTEEMQPIRTTLYAINRRIDHHGVPRRRRTEEREGASALWTPSRSAEVSALTTRFVLHSVSDILSAPRPEYLLDSHVVQGSLAFLYGPSGVGKSFFALDWACCVATGTRWLGHDVVQGPVIYVAAEGSGGLQKRLTAWQEAHGFDEIADLYFVTEPLNLRSPGEVRAFIDMVAEVGPVLIILDTYARCISGAEENSAKEMGEAIEGIDLIRTSTSAALVVVHHTGKSGESERGSSSLRGAADTMMKLSGGRGLLRLECDKQKDDEPFSPQALCLHPAGRSCVIRPAEQSTMTPALTEPERRLLQVMQPGKELTAGEMHRLGAGSESTCRRTAQALTGRGILELVSDRPTTFRLANVPDPVKDETVTTTTSLDVVDGGRDGGGEADAA